MPASPLLRIESFCRPPALPWSQARVWGWDELEMRRLATPYPVAPFAATRMNSDISFDMMYFCGIISILMAFEPLFFYGVIRRIHLGFGIVVSYGRGSHFFVDARCGSSRNCRSSWSIGLSSRRFYFRDSHHILHCYRHERRENSRNYLSKLVCHFVSLLFYYKKT